RRAPGLLSLPDAGLALSPPPRRPHHPPALVPQLPPAPLAAPVGAWRCLPRGAALARPPARLWPRLDGPQSAAPRALPPAPRRLAEPARPAPRRVHRPLPGGERRAACGFRLYGPCAGRASRQLRGRLPVALSGEAGGA